MAIPVSVPIIAVILIFALLLFLGAWLASSRALARREPDPPSTPADLGLEYQQVTFPARDGVRLAGRLVGKGDRPVIVFCAGMFGSMDGDTAFLPVLVEAGFDVLQFDWRAHGASEGRQSSLGLREPLDVLGALDWLELRGVKHVGLMGFSFGGAVAIRAAGLDKRPLCVLCDGAFVRLDHAAEGLLAERFGRGRASLFRPFVGLTLFVAGLRLRDTLRRAEPLDAAGQIAPRPVMFIHGAVDPIVPNADQDAVFDACRQPKSMWRVDGAGHRQAHLLQPDEYHRHVIEFFDEHLRRSHTRKNRSENQDVLWPT